MKIRKFCRAYFPMHFKTLIIDFSFKNHHRSLSNESGIGTERKFCTHLVNFRLSLSRPTHPPLFIIPKY